MNNHILGRFNEIISNVKDLVCSGAYEEALKQMISSDFRDDLTKLFNDMFKEAGYEGDPIGLDISQYTTFTLGDWYTHLMSNDNDLTTKFLTENLTNAGYFFSINHSAQGPIEKHEFYNIISMGSISLFLYQSYTKLKGLIKIDTNKSSDSDTSILVPKYDPIMFSIYHYAELYISFTKEPDQSERKLLDIFIELVNKHNPEQIYSFKNLCTIAAKHKLTGNIVPIHDHLINHSKTPEILAIIDINKHLVEILEATIHKEKEEIPAPISSAAANLSFHHAESEHVN